jgi:hypothetical protein
MSDAYTCKRPSIFIRDNPLVREDVTKAYDRKGSVGKKTLVVSQNGLGAKMS